MRDGGGAHRRERDAHALVELVHLERASLLLRDVVLEAHLRGRGTGRGARSVVRMPGRRDANGTNEEVSRGRLATRTSSRVTFSFQLPTMHLLP